MEDIKQKLTQNLEDERKKLRTAQDDVVRAQQAVERFNWKIEFIESLLDEAQITDSTVNPTANVHATAKPKIDADRFVALMTGTTPAWVCRVLKEAGKPMRMRDIIEAIVERNLAGANPDRRALANNVSSALNRANHVPNTSMFRKVSRGVYDLKSRG